MKLITGIENNKIVDSFEFENIIKCFNGKKVDITVNKHSDKRTNPQNDYWWAVPIELIARYAYDLGEDHTEKEWHYYYVNKGYFGYKEMNGEQVPKGSSEATTQEFNQAIERVQREWAIRGLVIPDPNQDEFIEDKIKVKRYEDSD